jgi:hypothetical protein
VLLAVLPLTCAKLGDVLYHDAAIVEPPRGQPFVLVVPTCGIRDEKRAHKLVADIARAVYLSSH